MRKKSLILQLSYFSLILGIAMMMLTLGLASPAQAASGKAPDKILFGNPIALSGPYSMGAMMSQIRSYDMWVEDVNAKGGIHIEYFAVHADHQGQAFHMPLDIHSAHAEFVAVQLGAVGRFQHLEQNIFCFSP